MSLGGEVTLRPFLIAIYTQNLTGSDRSAQYVFFHTVKRADAPKTPWCEKKETHKYYANKTSDKREYKHSAIPKISRKKCAKHSDKLRYVIEFYPTFML